MPKYRSNTSPKDSYLELLVTEKMRLMESVRNEETMEYILNINRALSAYTESEIRNMKTFVETKQRNR